MVSLLLLIFGAIIIGSGFASLIISLRQNKADSQRYLGVGIFLFAIAHFPTVFVNLGVITISFDLVRIIYGSALLLATAGNVLFLKSLFLMQRKNNFWFTKFPVLLFFAVIAITGIPFLLTGNQSVPFSLSFNLLAFQAVVHIYLGISFLKHIKQAPLMKKGLLILGIAWLSLAVFDVLTWHWIMTFPTEFWVIRLASIRGIFIAKAGAFVLLLVGLLFLRRASSQKAPSQ